MLTPRLIGASAATLAIVMAALVAAFVALAPSPTSSKTPRGLGRFDMAAPTSARDAGPEQPGVDLSVPPASSLPLRDATGEPAPTF